MLRAAGLFGGGGWLVRLRLALASLSESSADECEHNGGNSEGHFHHDLLFRSSSQECIRLERQEPERVAFAGQKTTRRCQLWNEQKRKERGTQSALV